MTAKLSLKMILKHGCEMTILWNVNEKLWHTVENDKICLTWLKNDNPKSDQEADA